jgi:hypothetical protein
MVPTRSTPTLPAPTTIVRSQRPNLRRHQRPNAKTPRRAGSPTTTKASTVDCTAVVVDGGCPVSSAMPVSSANAVIVEAADRGRSCSHDNHSRLR